MSISTATVSDAALKDIVRSLADVADVADSSGQLRERYRALLDSIDVSDNYVVEVETNITEATLSDSISAEDFVTATFYSGLTQFYVYHGVEGIEIERGIELLGVNHGIFEDTA